MAQTPAKSVAEGEKIDYTPVAAVVAGAIIEVGNRAFPVPINIAAGEKSAYDTEGLWDVPKATGALNAGDAIFWDNDGTPNVGDASSGAATATAAGNKFLGYASADAASDAKYVRVRLADGPTTNSLPSFPVEAVVATGSAQGDAAAIGGGTGLATVTAADATKGVILPAGTAGKIVLVKNVDNAVLKVYPPSGGTINVLSANAAISLAARTFPAFVYASATQIYTLPLLPS